MSEDYGERLTRLEVQQEGFKEDIKRVEKSAEDDINSIKRSIFFVVAIVISFVINKVLSLFSIGGGQ